MPEGDTIAGYAVRLRRHLVGSVLVDVSCRWPAVIKGLEGEVVDGVEVHGKNLLILVGPAVIHVHLRMKGRWVYGDRFDPSELALLLRTPEHQAVCLSAPIVRRLDRRAIGEPPGGGLHGAFPELGPCLLHEHCDLSMVVERMLAAPDRELGAVLLDQRVVAGLGNVYRSELPFFVRIHPFRPVGEIPSDALLRMVSAGRRWLQQNIGRSRNTTGRPSPAHYVYGRARRPCLRCSARLESRRDHNNRVATYCPRCQPA